MGRVWIEVLLLPALALVNSTASADQRQQPPDEAAQQAVQRQVRDIFDFPDANTPSKKMELAKKLAKLAGEVADDPAGQFVMLRMAARLTSEAGQLGAALETIGQIEDRFEVDGLTLRAECVRTALGAARGSTAVKKGIRTALPVVEEAFAADRFELAASLVKTLQNRLPTARDRELAHQLADLRRRGSELFRIYQRAKSAFDTLKTNPMDPEANLIAGKHLCYAKDDWERGLPMLALGTDDALKALALSELKPPEAAPGQAKLGHAWWDWAEAADKPGKAAGRRRAAHWYRQALPELTGLAKLKVTKRLEQVPKVSSSGARKTPQKDRTINLIALIDPKQDALKGEWHIVNGQLVCTTPHFVPKLKIPYQPPEEYDFRIVFSQAKVRNPVIQVMSKGGKAFVWSVGGTRGRFAFGLKDRLDRDNPLAAERPGLFHPGMKYESIVKVRNGSVQAWVNGRMAFNHKTDYSDLGLGSPWYGVKDESVLTIGCDDPTTFHVVEVTAITGEGKRLRQKKEDESK